VEQTFTYLDSVIATSEPSLLGLTGYPMGRSPGAHAVGPWAICYTYPGRYCRIRNTKERCGRGDRMKSTYTNFTAAYLPFLSPYGRKRRVCKRP
jgi:hypothetical protein